MTTRLRTTAQDLLWLLPALAFFAGIAYYFSFTQDDAYISYRYVANYLNGHGLVYNIGERVEGYTNFGWVIYLILWGAIGVGYIAVSKVTGFLCGLGVIVVTYSVGRVLFGEKEKMWSAVPAFLIGANMSLAYWSPAGLETAAFSLATSLCVFWYLKRNPLLIAGLLWAVLLRPEGAVVAGLLIVIEAVTERRTPLFSLRAALMALVLSLPFVGFKLGYYHSLLPNPFYAKTGFSATSVQNGAQYVWESLRDYGAAGAGLLITAIFWGRLVNSRRVILLFTTGFLLYVLLIGGDVLKVHRFFLPVAGLSALVLIVAVSELLRTASRQTKQFSLVMALLILTGLTLYFPFNTVKGFNRAEKVFTLRMAALAMDMKTSDSTSFSAALPTIGIFGYTLLGHDVIDMVGLTDSTIARYSELPVPGMVTTWKERKHNSAYLLSRAPDYVVFSTGVKPSAPAEKALMMYSSFQDAYRAIGWVYTDPVVSPTGSTLVAFKKVRPVVGPFVADYPLEYVDLMKQGTEAYATKRYKDAVTLLEKAITVAGGKKPSPELLYTLGYCTGGLRGETHGLEYLNQAVAQDSFAFGAHRDLYMYEMAMGDRQRGLIHRQYLLKNAPWYVPRLDSMLQDALSKAGKPMPDFQ